MPTVDLLFERGLQLTQATDFTFTDDATPLGIDDSSGSTGAMTVNFDRQGMRPALMKQLKGQAVILSLSADEQRAIGKVTHSSGTEAGVGIDIDSVALRLAVARSAKPFTGTLEDAMRYWASLVKIDPAQVQVDASIASKQVALVGFHDNVWLRIKQLVAAVGIEVVIQDDTIVVRPPRAVVISARSLSATSWDVDDTSMAQTIEVYYYDPQSIVAGDYTADYSRSNVDPANADDAGAGQATANRAANQLPPGYTKRGVLIVS